MPATPRRKPQLYSLRETTFQPAGRALTVEGNRVKDVKICGFVSARGREYPPDVLREAVNRGLYENKFSNTDHTATSAGAPQSTAYASRFGWAENVRFVDGDGVRGDYCFNPKHPLAESFVWWCQNKPEAVGLSHDADGEGDYVNGKFRVKRIESVATVDLVADPASNSRGLLESATPRPRYPEPFNVLNKKFREILAESTTTPLIKTALTRLIEANPGYGEMMGPCAMGENGAAPGPNMDAAGAGDHSQDILSAIAKLLQQNTPAAQAAVKALMKVLVAYNMANANQPNPLDGLNLDETAPADEVGDDGVGKNGPPVKQDDDKNDGDTADDATPPDDAEKKKKMPPMNESQEIAALRREVDELKLEKRTAAKLTEARQLCKNAKLPDDAVTDVFIADLVAQPDAKAMQARIDDRRALLESARKAANVRYKPATPISNSTGGATGNTEADEKAAFEHFCSTVTSGDYTLPAQ